MKCVSPCYINNIADPIAAVKKKSNSLDRVGNILIIALLTFPRLGLNVLVFPLVSIFIF